MQYLVETKAVQFIKPFKDIVVKRNKREVTSSDIIPTIENEFFFQSRVDTKGTQNQSLNIQMKQV